MPDTQTMLEGFVDDEAPEGPPPVVLDRSTLERWATCPHQAHHVDRGLVSSGSTEADSGNECHDILAAAVDVRHRHAVPARDLREYIDERAVKSRPDVQPEVVKALRKSYPVVHLLCHHDNGEERNPDDILRYDGGEGDRRGQLGGDILPAPEDGSRGPVRLTCEVDLLLATASPEELDLWDWKSGWRYWTAGEVKESFQFQFYAWLVFHTYPEVRRVWVRVFMTREGAATSVVEFSRGRDLYQIHQRLLSAANLYLKFRDAGGPEDVDAWPAPDKCSICPAATRCLMAHLPERDLAADPEGYLRQYVATQAAADRMAARMAVKVRAEGRDMVFRDPAKGAVAFGMEKPKEVRKPACVVYEPA